MEKYTWINEFLDAVEKSLGFMDLSTLQPTSWRHFQPLIAKEWLEWFWEIIQERGHKQIPYSALAKVFEPDLCREHLIFTLEDLKTARWPREKRLKVADFLYQILKVQMPQGDLFGLRGTTRRHTKTEVEEMLKKKFEKGTPEIARELGKLYNAVYNLGASLYLDFYMGKAVENWGPYKLKNGEILVIKQMRHLKPVKVWPNINTDAEKLTLYAVYKNVEFSTDLIACHTQYRGDTINGLVRWRLEKDNRVVHSLSAIKELRESITRTGALQWRKLILLPEKQLIQKAIWVRCYCFNRLCETLGLDWKPSQKLLRAPQGKTLNDGWKRWRQPKDRDTFNAYWRKVWDPRLDFYG